MPWKTKENALHGEFEFADFVTAFAFMTEVAFAAEAVGHHPEWTNIYNKVRIRLTTHDAGATITAKDHSLAAAIAKIYEKYA